MKLRIFTASGKTYDVILDDEDDSKHLEKLRKAVATTLAIDLDLRSPTELARLKLVHKGIPLSTDDNLSSLRDGSTLIAALAPKPPSQQMREQLFNSAGGSSGGLMAEDLAEEREADMFLRIKLDPTRTHPWVRSTVLYLRDSLRVPEPLLALLLQLKLRFWVGMVGWIVIAKASSMVDLGGPWIILTCFFTMFVWIGFDTRARGSLSGYSLFNPNVQRLPGQLTAEHMDAQMRRGHM